ncbi:glyoxylate/succinic semialdehyde reductase 1-like isoform X1 [Panicum virgatum]|uniref:glyoxylate/succinic semialdehyde reductase 1-like isoform X1 n=1 Tax=Panicum virgatum TaxID=38727 RepID=UPI0019D5AF1F|nr:glyoxylate/succinic semialdehyde reductase 1-like isoform X1 [Panicum virgatum]
MMNPLSEGLCLADKSGLSAQTLLDVLDLGAIANPMFKLKGPAMLQGSYSPAFPLKHQQKDMRLALALGDENAVSMPVSAAANEAFKRTGVIGNQWSHLDARFAAVSLVHCKAIGSSS